MRHAFLFALQFLSRLPVPGSFTLSDRQLGQSVLFYPLVGALIGLVLWSGSLLLSPAPADLHAALILALWVFLSGGLHLDGLADCADAWIGGLGNREKTLAIMKDPAAGTVAVVVLFLVLLLKWTALHALLAADHTLTLLAVPALSRGALLILMLTTPYIRKQGMGEKLIQNLPRPLALGIALLTFLAGFGILGWPVLAGMLLTLLLIRQTAIARLGGMTGDVYGASVELTETTALITLALNV